MSVTHVIGIDPGLVHTGVVSMYFMSNRKTISVMSLPVLGLDAQAVQRAALDFEQQQVAATNVRSVSPKPRIFIEGYRPRGNLSPDRRMQEGVTNIQRATKGKVLDNMGVKKVVKKDLMHLLGVWDFSTTTHHQDLRSAGRIGVLGMLKDDRLNMLVADVVEDHLDGETWTVLKP